MIKKKKTSIRSEREVELGEWTSEWEKKKIEIIYANFIHDINFFFFFFPSRRSQLFFSFQVAAATCAQALWDLFLFFVD